MRKPKIICICGSSKFIEHIAILGWELEKQGAIVLSLHFLPQSYPNVQTHHQAEAEGLKEQMDELHLRKIDLCDEVLVVNVDGYIGESTGNEIKYAEQIGKPVKYYQGVWPLKEGE